MAGGAGALEEGPGGFEFGDGGGVVRIGGDVTTSGDVFSPNHCPVWLRDRDTYAVNVGVGDTPKIFTLGNGARHT